MLWFDFILYLWIIENNHTSSVGGEATVVIWFHLVSLNYWKQPVCINPKRSQSCDLISSCIFELLKTTQENKQARERRLWFDFILYLWIIENNKGIVNSSAGTVVIWFHLVSLNYWKQHMTRQHTPWAGCDLISSCIFELLKTTK